MVTDVSLFLLFRWKKRERERESGGTEEEASQWPNWLQEFKKRAVMIYGLIEEDERRGVLFI